MSNRPTVDWGARRRDIRALLAQGLSQKEAALRLGLSQGSVSLAMKDEFPRRTKLKQVCLADLPLSVRMQAAHRAAKLLSDTVEEREDLIFAALFPSERKYWVSVSAEPELAAA